MWFLSDWREYRSMDRKKRVGECYSTIEKEAYGKMITNKIQMRFGNDNESKEPVERQGEQCLEEDFF